MKPLIILTSLNFVVCCFLIVKSRMGDSGPDPNAKAADAPRDWVEIDIDKEPGDLNLKELLDKPRAELAQLAVDYEEQIVNQEKKRREGALEFKTLPASTRFPLALPVWRQASYSAVRDMVLPPYLGETEFDSNLALHLARYGDVEAARKIVDPGDTDAQAEIASLALIRNYPVEWTRLVTLILHRAHYSLAEANPDGGKRVVALHRQLYNLMNDNEVRQSRLATTLLSYGRLLLHEATLTWCDEIGREEYLDMANRALADWGSSPVPVLPPARSPEQLATWLGGKVEGLLVRSGNTLRALDMLELPLPGAPAAANRHLSPPVDGVVALFEPNGSLKEILVVYGRIDDPFETRRLTYWLEEQVANSSRLKLGFHFENYPNNLDGNRSVNFVAPITIVRLAPKASQPAESIRLPRDFGLVNLDRTFETNRRFFAWSLSGTRLEVKDARPLAGVKWPYSAQKFSLAVLNRDPRVDVVSDFQLVFEKDPAGRGSFIDAASPIWRAIGAGRIDVTGPTDKDSVNLVWTDGTTQLTLAFRNDQEATFVDIRDASGTNSEQRLAAAMKEDTAERRVRWADGKTMQRLSRSFGVFELGMTRAALEQRIGNRMTLRNETPAGDLLTFPGAVTDEAAEWALRQCLVRFDESGRLAEARMRFTDTPGKTGSVQRLLASIKQTGGAPEFVTVPDNTPGGNPKGHIKLQRWQDDKTFLEARVEPQGIDLVMKDCPLDYPQGAPFPAPNFLPRGPEPRCVLGTDKEEFYKQWKIATPTLTSDFGTVLNPGDKSPYEVYVVYFEGERVSRIVARFRQTGELLTQPAAAGKAMTTAWGQHAQAFGWPWQQTFNRQGHLQAWSNHDDATLVRIFWQNYNESGLRVVAEWK
jgi:hypothetical protein